MGYTVDNTILIIQEMNEVLPIPTGTDSEFLIVGSRVAEPTKSEVPKNIMNRRMHEWKRLCERDSGHSERLGLKAVTKDNIGTRVLWQ